MDQRFEELPRWVFQIEELSPNVYRAEGVHDAGTKVSTIGTDESAVLTDVRRMARAVDEQLAARAKT